MRRQWASQDAHHDHQWWRAELEGAGLRAKAERSKDKGPSYHQLGSILSGELNGESRTRTEAGQADGKTSLWELQMASGSVLT